MSLYVAHVGDVVIKPEIRKDFGRFFNQNYSLVTNTLLKQFIANYDLLASNALFIPICLWKHDNWCKEWEGKYETSYNKETGRFIFGASYNLHGLRAKAMIEFFGELLPAITECELFLDDWVEPM